MRGPNICTPAVVIRLKNKNCCILVGYSNLPAMLLLNAYWLRGNGPYYNQSHEFLEKMDGKTSVFVPSIQAGPGITFFFKFALPLI